MSHAKTMGEQADVITELKAKLYDAGQLIDELRHALEGAEKRIESLEEENSDLKQRTYHQHFDDENPDSDDESLGINEEAAKAVADIMQSAFEHGLLTPIGRHNDGTGPSNDENHDHAPTSDVKKEDSLFLSLAEKLGFGLWL